jgi:thymidylate synthase ThyX
MSIIDEAYRDLLSLGVPTEDARGIAPLHLRSGMGISLTFRDLSDMFRSRTCHVLQQTYWAPIARQMARDLEKIDKELLIVFNPPCLRPEKRCVSVIEARTRSEHVLAINGKAQRNDLYPCRIYNAMFEDSRIAHSIDGLVRAGVTRWAPSPQEEEG